MQEAVACYSSSSYCYNMQVASLVAKREGGCSERNTAAALPPVIISDYSALSLSLSPVTYRRGTGAKKRNETSKQNSYEMRGNRDIVGPGFTFSNTGIWYQA